MMFLTVAGPAAMVAPGPWKHPATHNRSRIAAGGKHRAGPVGRAAGQCLHVDVVGKQKAVEPELPPNQRTDHGGRNAGRAQRIDIVEDDVRHHRTGQRLKRTEWHEIARFQVGAGRVDVRRLVMAVDDRAPVPWQVLDHRKKPPGEDAPRQRPGEQRDQFGIVAEGPVADRVRRPRRQHVRDRNAVHGDAQGAQFRCKDATQQKRRPVPRLAVAQGQIADGARGRQAL
jgi:hypothetical protein